MNVLKKKRDFLVAFINKLGNFGLFSTRYWSENIKNELSTLEIIKF